MKRWLPLLVLASLSCGSPPIVPQHGDLQVRTQWTTSDGTQALDYGPVAVLDSKTLRISLKNLGRVRVRITPPPTVQSDEPVFSLDLTGLPSSMGTEIDVEPGATIQLAVIFTPTEEKPYSGTVTLLSDSSTSKTTTVALVGTGSTVGKLESPPDLDFGRVCEEEQDVKTVNLKSVGTGPLIIQSVALVDPPDEISIAGSAQVPARLEPPTGGQPGGLVEVPIRCSPKQGSPVDLEATLEIKTTDPTQRDINVKVSCHTNRAPLPVIAPLTVSAAPGRTVPLDGSGSYDPDGDTPLIYFWSSDTPSGSSADFTDHGSALTTFPIDVAGNYKVHLDVVDAAGCSCIPDDAGHCSTLPLQALSPDDLKFELVWDNPRTDLDIHVVEVAPGNDYYGPEDCYSGTDKGTSPDPLGFLDDCADFGAHNDSSDDPVISPDDLEGIGPEVVVLGLGDRVVTPGIYEVGVVFRKTNGADDPTTHATVRIYVYGVLVAQKIMLLTPPTDKVPGDRWQAFDVTWPDAANGTGVDYVGTIGQDSAP